MRELDLKKSKSVDSSKQKKDPKTKKTKAFLKLLSTSLNLPKIQISTMTFLIRLRHI